MNGSSRRMAAIVMLVVVQAIVVPRVYGTPDVDWPHDWHGVTR